MMNKELLEKYLSGACNDAEKLIVESWYDSYEMTSSSLHDGEKEALDQSAIRSLAEMKSKIGEEWSTETPQIEHTDRTLRPLRWSSRWSWAVAAAAIILFALVWTRYYSNPTANNETIVHNDVLPGEDKAILELADGRSIALNADGSEGVLLNEAGISIKKTKDGQLMYVLSNDNQQGNADENNIAYNTITTPRSGRYSIILPDGSKVILNAESKIRYAVPFERGSRKVDLQGEAFFEVVQVSEKMSTGEVQRIPFVVYAGDQRIEVLGTSFNVNAYHDENKTTTSLISGKVEVSLKADPKRLIPLTPGFAATSDSEGFRRGAAHLESVTAWKNNYFYFNDQHISTITKQISRWYDVDFVYEKDINISELYFSGSVSNEKNLSQVLRLMERTGMVKFKIEGRRVIVMD